MSRDERDPYTDVHELPVDEVGDFGSFAREPDGGNPAALEPELEPLDLVADEPDPDDDNPLGGVV
jgi:hypothetical protein